MLLSSPDNHVQGVQGVQGVQEETPPMNIDWGGLTLIDLDDGHVPETLSGIPTRLVDYSLFHTTSTDSEATNQVHVYQDVVKESVADRAYEKTISEPHPAWGDYVTIEQIQTYWQKQKDHNPQETLNADEESSGLTLELAAEFLRLALSDGSLSSPQPSLVWAGDKKTHSKSETRVASPLCDATTILSQAHGVAVWALRATVGSQVPYHLDYAEQVRYQSNVIVPPLVAGTLQCTRDPIQGGDFVVWLDGISHYQEHGYKGKRKPVDLEASTTTMIQIPYRFNQLTCHLGHLPHASTLIRDITARSPEQPPQQRVVVGFNAFCQKVGPFVQQAPEHSAAFREQVQRRRRFRKDAKTCLDSDSSKRLTLKAIQQNKYLSKCLVLAKREKIKQEFERAQQELEKELSRFLPGTVQDVMNALYGIRTEKEKSTSMIWPASPTDVHVFLHHQVLQGNLALEDLKDHPRACGGPSSLISLQATIRLSSSKAQ